MGTTLKVNLTAKSFKKAANEVIKYANSLKKKDKLFVDELLKRGITVAKEHAQDVPGTFGTHQMGSLVTFSKELIEKPSGYKGILVGMGQEVFSKISEGRSINSLLALEFGTAGLALSPQHSFHGFGGKGTNSESGHQNDDVWYVYIDEVVGETRQRRVKMLSAIEPTRPMYNAATKMLQDIREVAVTVFKTNKVIQC